MGAFAKAMTRGTFVCGAATVFSLSLLEELLAAMRGTDEPEPMGDGSDGDPAPTPSQGRGGNPALPPEGATLVGFKYNAQGMWMGPYCAIRQVDGGGQDGPDGPRFECTQTSAEIYWLAMDGEDALEWLETSEDGGYAYDPYTSYGDPLDATTSMFSSQVIGEEEMAELLDILVEHDVLSWDGFDEARTYDDAEFQPTDTGASFHLQLLFSDGTRMEAHGIDAYPDGYNEAVGAIMGFFEEHEDLSQFYPEEFPDAQVDSLVIELIPTGIFTSFDQRFCIELHSGWDQWIVRLSDPSGQYLPAGTDISEYGTIEGGIGQDQFVRFIDILRAYGLESWNQRDEVDHGEGGELWSVRISFANNQHYQVNTNAHPERYEEFREAIALEIYAFYEEVAG